MVWCTRGVVCAERTLEATPLSHSPTGMRVRLWLLQNRMERTLGLKAVAKPCLSSI
jgi:hypothetical protein